jgi:uncharacterized protein
MALRDDLLPQLGARDVINTFFGVLAPLFVVVLVLAITGVDAGSTPALYVLKDYAYALIIGGGVYLFAIVRPGASWQALGFRRCEVDWLVRAALLAVILYFLHIAAEKLLISLTFDRLQPRTSDAAIFTGGSAGLGVLLSAVMLIVTPVVTEIFLRGILFAWLRRNLDFFLSALASSIILGVYHVEIVKYFAVIVFGVVASWLYERSRSLWPTILFHMSINGLYIVQLIVGGARLP